MRRNAGGHAHGNPLGAVDQKIGDLHRKDAGFLFGLVKIGDKIHNILIQVGQESLLRDLLQPGFRVTHGGGTVPFNISEVAVAVYEGKPLFKFLGQNH